MTLGLPQISIIRKKNIIKPKFVGSEDIPNISLLITRLSSYVGRKYSEVDFNELENIFLDWKIGRGLVKVLLNTYFSLKEVQMHELLGYEGATKLAQLKITRPLELRLEFFKFVQKEYDGVIPDNEYESALQKAAEYFHIPDGNTLLELLFLDNIRNYRIEVRKEYTPQEIAGFYNFEVIMSLLYYALSLSVTVKSKNYGFIAKKVYLECKRHGILVDFLLDSKNNLIIKMTGAKQLFGRQIKYGLAMTYALAQVFKLMKQVKLEKWSLSADLEIRKKRYSLKIDSNDLEYFIPTPLSTQSEWETFFDSDVEKRIYWIFKSTTPRGWSIEREPEPIQVENFLVIPDFALRKDGTMVLLEIVGYWRDEYIEKKKQKYMILCKYDLPILLLIDRKIISNFKEIPCEKVAYTRTSTGKIDFSWKSFFKALEKLSNRYNKK